MKKGKKIMQLNKVTVAHLTKINESEIQGGSSNFCWAIGSYFAGKIVDYFIERGISGECEAVN